MRKSTLSLGVISSVLFVIAVLFKFQHWPGAGICLAVSLLIFALIYSPLLMIDRNSFAKDSTQRLTNLVGMFGMTIIGISVLFKLMHWPGAGVGVIIGNLTLVILIPILFYRASKETEAIKRLNSYNEAIVLIFLTGFSLFIWLIISPNLA